MPSLNDTIYNKLGTLGFTGSLNDRLTNYYADYLGVSLSGKSLSHLERQFLFDKLGGATGGSNQDLWATYLLSLGHSGSLADMMYVYWGELGVSFDFTFGGSLTLVRDHEANDVTNIGTLTLPNRVTTYGLPAYSQAVEANKPTIEETAGIKWLKSDWNIQTVEDGSQAQYLKTPAGADALGTEGFFVIKRLAGGLDSAYFLGQDNQINKLVGFRRSSGSHYMHTLNVVSGVTSGVVEIPDETWMVLRLKSDPSVPYSCYTAYNSDGSVLDHQERSSTPSGVTLDLLLGSWGSGEYTEPAHAGFAKAVIYAIDGGAIPALDVTAIVAELNASFVIPMNGA